MPKRDRHSAIRELGHLLFIFGRESARSPRFVEQLLRKVALEKEDAYRLWESCDGLSFAEIQLHYPDGPDDYWPPTISIDHCEFGPMIESDARALAATLIELADKAAAFPFPKEVGK
ncbi:MAG: hypothetical protein M0R37_13420 [Bacteroidales bacterium]|nr:hypothetical protein [Bacteroidales bacterium]